MDKGRIFRVIIAFILLSSSIVYPAFADEQELAKKSQNPVGDIISLPFEYWHHDGMANDGSADALMAKPVYPVRFGSLNLINRIIIPYLGIDANLNGSDLGEVDVPASNTSESGLGNIQYQGFFTPANPDKVIWGVAPVFEFPTNTSGLGSDKWSAGGGVLALTMPGNWVVGALIQNIWSFAGPSGDPDVNKFTFQYFINYNLGDGWYLTSTPIITADWEKSSGNQWTVPFGGGFGRLMRFGKLPVDFKLQVFGNVEKPEGGPDWSMMFAVKFLFPKGKPAKISETPNSN